MSHTARSFILQKATSIETDTSAYLDRGEGPKIGGGAGGKTTLGSNLVGDFLALGNPECPVSPAAGAAAVASSAARNLSFVQGRSRSECVSIRMHDTSGGEQIHDKDGGLKNHGSLVYDCNPTHLLSREIRIRIKMRKKTNMACDCDLRNAANMFAAP